MDYLCPSSMTGLPRSYLALQSSGLGSLILPSTAVQCRDRQDIGFQSRYSMHTSFRTGFCMTRFSRSSQGICTHIFMIDLNRTKQALQRQKGEAAPLSSMVGHNRSCRARSGMLCPYLPRMINSGLNHPLGEMLGESVPPIIHSWSPQ